MWLGTLHRTQSNGEERQDPGHLRDQDEDAVGFDFFNVRIPVWHRRVLSNSSLTMTKFRETNVQGLLLEVIQQAAPDAYVKRTKRAGIVNAWNDKNFAQAVRETGETAQLGQKARVMC